MPPIVTTRSLGAQDGCATRRMQQKDRNRAQTKSSEGERRARKSVLSIALRRERYHGSGVVGNDKAAKKGKSENGDAASSLSENAREGECSRREYNEKKYRGMLGGDDKRQDGDKTGCRLA